MWRRIGKPLRFGLTEVGLDTYNVGTVAELLGTFEQAVLLTVVKLADGAYGRSILREVQVRLSREVAAGAIRDA